MPTELWEAMEITIDRGDHFKRVNNSREALACLMTCWPNRSGKAFAVAKKACLDAIEGRAEPAAASKAFKAAAKEAGLLCR
ncbi:DUF982 domain-containing protein [Rhizobium sp. Leaf391]|uniref:DUF982 domain-containing protein n=1 Tax=Rhizobium sp. Leaf391 TaxID=1736360 RepID=UPI0007869243|nr:DUF982 domain-containing protein [Rhizobium sp. Leaf391]